jgi:hypothetical protein
VAIGKFVAVIGGALAALRAKHGNTFRWKFRFEGLKIVEKSGGVNGRILKPIFAVHTLQYPAWHTPSPYLTLGDRCGEGHTQYAVALLS